MKSVYTSPLFWAGAFDRAKRTAAQFGLAYLLAMFGSAASHNFRPFTINFLDFVFWVTAGLLISLITSIMFPKHVIGPLSAQDEDYGTP